MTTHAEIVAEQRSLWGTAPRDWAELAERENEPLFLRVLDAAGVAAGTRLLDIGCGSGLLCELGAARGAVVSGIDITPGLLQIARERVPAGDFREADMSVLPFPDSYFDVVTGINSFQFAPDSRQAFTEAARVLRGGGRLAVAAFAEPERSEGTVMHLAMKQLIVEVEGEEDGYAPYALSSEEGLIAALTAAGLAPVDAVEVAVDWRYADTDTTLRGLFASAGGARAIRAVGRERVEPALRTAMQQFKGEDGAVTMHNLFRYALAEKPA
jgi:SAM-dependent methyltransferase